jgi:uncharacterized RDD family membrane protein YckC
MIDELTKVPVGLTTEGLLGKRYLAGIIDSILIAVLFGGLAGVVGALLGRTRAGPAIMLLLLLVTWIGYGTILESWRWQASVGKLWMGLKVYNPQAGRLGAMQAAGRNLVKDGPFLMLVFVPGGRVLSLLWLGAHLVVLHRSPIYQAIHDRAANTWVAAPEATIRLHLSSSAGL